MVPSIFGENMLDDFFDGGFFGAHNPLYGKNARNLMKTDIREMDDSYELAVDLPGFKKDEINLDIKDGYSNISVFPSEAYGLPWVIFYPSVPTGENFYIKLTCLPDSIVKTQQAPPASNVIKIISPDSPNINNVGELHERIYDRITELEGRKVTAMVIEYKTDKRDSIFFVYGEMLVEVRCDPAVWDAKWFSCLSFESIAG